MIALAQIDSRIGDLAGNLERIRAAHRRAARLGARLVLYPEMVLTGYPPRDLLCDPEFCPQAERALHSLTDLEGPALVVGAPLAGQNAAVVIQGGQIRAVQGKRCLPSYDVFHEARWFTPGQTAEVVRLPGLPSFEILICEDLWRELPPSPAEICLCLNASPYRQGVLEHRLEHARRRGKPVYSCNAVGAQDELIFDGASFCTEGGWLPRFEEAVDFPRGPRPELESAEELRRALVSGIAGFFAKNGIPRAVLGLSGGIDSALVACLAAEALGPKRVLALALPSRYTDPRSIASARQLAERLGIELEEVPVEPLFEPALQLLAAEGTAAENLQARLRMVVLMARVNQRGGLLLNTSNKTELSLGYGTLYGDLCGTLGPLNDLTKPQVYQLASLYSEIPLFIRERPPSAELAREQVDPFDYSVLAPEVECDIQLQVWRTRTAVSEHKRRQGAIGLKVSEKAFGSGRFVPVTARVVYPDTNFCYDPTRAGALRERSRNGQPGQASASGALHLAGGGSASESPHDAERADHSRLRGGHREQRSGGRCGMSRNALCRRPDGLPDARHGRLSGDNPNSSD